MKLKKNVKYALLTILLILVGIALTQIFIKRIEQINSDTFITISDSEMDR